MLKKKEPAAAAVQMRNVQSHPFGMLESYTPLRQGEIRLYRAIREALPIVDAAVCKLVRLCGGVKVECEDRRAQRELERFLRTVPTGRGQRGLQSFLDQYLDSMLVCGMGIGEIVPAVNGREVAAVLCGNPADLEIQEGGSPLELTLCVRRRDGSVEPMPRQDLLLFTPFQPEADAPYGVSLISIWR